MDRRENEASLFVILLGYTTALRCNKEQGLEWFSLNDNEFLFLPANGVIHFQAVMHEIVTSFLLGDDAFTM